MHECKECGLYVRVSCTNSSDGAVCKAARHQEARDVTAVGDVAVLGRMQFHSQTDLRDRFYYVVDDLRQAACVVDLWLHDIAKVMEEYGYEMTIKRLKP